MMETKVKIVSLRDSKEARLKDLEKQKIKMGKKGYTFKEYIDDGRRNSYAIFEADAPKVITDKIYGWVKFIIIALLIYGIFFMKDEPLNETKKNATTTNENPVEKLVQFQAKPNQNVSSVIPINFSSKGKIKEAFSYIDYETKQNNPDKVSKMEAVQNKIKEQIVGQVVEWSLPVWKIEKWNKDFIHKEHGGYSVSTSDTNGDIKAIIHLYVKDNKQMQYMDSFTLGENIQFKGRVKDIYSERILIRDAILTN